MLASGLASKDTDHFTSTEGYIEHLEVTLVEDDEAGLALAEALTAEVRIAIDLEAAGFDCALGLGRGDFRVRFSVLGFAPLREASFFCTSAVSR